MEDLIKVQVCYALPERQEIVSLQVTAGSSAEQAIVASGLLEKFPDIDLGRNKLGIHGKLAKADVILREGDRVEIYRPLIADPKEARRKRSEEGLKKQPGGEPPAA